MKIVIGSGQPCQQQTACLVLFVVPGAEDTILDSLNESASQILKPVLERQEPGKTPGETLLIPVPLGDKVERALLVSLGEKPLDGKSAFKVADGVAKALQATGVDNANLCLDSLEQYDGFVDFCQYLSQALVSSSYLFSKSKHETGDDKANKRLEMAGLLYNGSENISASVNRGISTGHGINVAKELGNLPGNVCTPSYLAAEAEKLAKRDNTSATTLNEKTLSELNMNAFLSVSKGSVEEGRLIIMEYRNGNSDDAPYVLLGKGITFDSGGISLKPGPRMDEMKYDMCGAASVMGVMTALTELKPAINVIGVIAAAENMPSAKASKPGDIVTSMSGKTIEILNTDAEGRLVLCDALTYIERFNPCEVIDIATLTGACITALGHHTSGLMSNDDNLAEELASIGKRYNDNVWRLPMGELYDKQLDSNFADLANIGGAPAGTITAGCFLGQFAQNYRWAHLDIAGTAWSGGKEKGATGRPVALLLNYLLTKAK